MDLIVNGKAYALESTNVLVDLLIGLELDSQPCAVEVNGQVVPKREHAACLLCEGDVIEIVTLVGGG